MRRFVRAWEAWLLLAVVGVFFRRPLISETFFFRDVYLLFVPKKFFLASALRAGEFPLWDPLTSGGQPYLASPQSTVFYPLNILFLFLPTLAAYNLLLVLQFAACALAAWWLGRVVGLGRAGAFVAGAIYAFAGYTLSTANLNLPLLAFPWVPLTLALTHRAILGRSHWRLAGAALAAAMPLLCGSAEIAAMLFAMTAAWVLTMPSAHRMRTRAVFTAFIVVFAVGVSLAQTLPATEMIAQSQRARGLSYDVFAEWSVSPRRLPELFVPRFLGPTTHFATAAYWGRRLETNGFPYILSIYFGAIALVAGMTGAISRAKRHEVPWRTLLLLATAGIGLSLGGNLPGFRQIYDFVPFIGTFRYPVKALTLAVLPIALLAGRGVEAASTSTRARRFLLATLACATLTAVATAYLVLSGRVTFEEWFGHRPAPLQLAGSLAHVAVFGAAGVSAVALMRRFPRAGTGLLASVILLDLTVAGINVNSYAPRSIFDPPPIVRRAKAIVGDGRLHSVWTAGERLELETPPLWNALTRMRIETLGPFVPVMYGIPTALGSDYDGLAPIHSARFGRRVRSMALGDRARLLKLSGARAISITGVTAIPGATLIEEIPSIDKARHYLFALDSSPATFVSRSVFARSENEALELTLRSTDPATIVISGTGQPAAGCGSHPVRIVERSINRVRYEVDAPCDGWVLFTENWYPGWKVRVDGVDHELLRAAYAFSAVAVPQGRHVVERSYQPRLPFIGMAASLAALVVLPFAAAFAESRLQKAETTPRADTT